jgi:hypothetical protein
MVRDRTAGKPLLLSHSIQGKGPLPANLMGADDGTAAILSRRRLAWLMHGARSKVSAL